MGTYPHKCWNIKVVILIQFIANGEAEACHTDSYHHDYGIKWKYFPRYRPFFNGIHRSPVDSHHRGQWRGALILSLMCAWTNRWASNRDAGDLRRHCAYYDVTVMIQSNHDLDYYHRVVHMRKIFYDINQSCKIANLNLVAVVFADVQALGGEKTPISIMPTVILK